ncbi:hypothetical protein ANO11243_071930 [Dothideomycetidae sp. 11243]|nr:hypothetical protein ANO11243_071930 [fungal sp. No.11243]
MIPRTSDKDKAYEDTISTRVKLVVLTTYLALTIAITLSTKAVIQHLKTPWMLTALHSTFTAFGCNILLWSRGQKFTRLCLRDNLVMLAFSSLFTINIAVSNISLGMVSVPFYQTVRSASPFCTVAIYRVVFGRKYSTATHMALLPIVLGVCMMTYGDYSFTAAGFFMTALGVVMASVKTITTNKILTGSRSLDSIEVLARMSPLAAVQSAFLGVVVGEVSTIADAFDQGGMTLGFCVGLLANCILALLLNISSFKVNKLAGALAQTVSGNVKQALTILLAIPIFGVQVGLIDGLGMATTLAGAMAFSFAELRARS